MKTTDFIVEYAGIGNDAEAMGADHDVQLARQDLYNTAKNAIELHARLKNISEETGLEGWVSEKITLAADYLATVNNYFAEQDQPDMDMLDSFSFESAEQQYEQLVNESAGDQAWSAGYQAFLDDVVKCPYPAGSDNAHTWSLGWESAQSRERTSESAEHPDEEEDKKLIKKMVKPTALKDGKVDEAFPHDVDHMPGRTVKNPMSGCKRCHGHGTIWKSPEGKVLAGNDVPGAKRYKCGACKGVGFVKESSDNEPFNYEEWKASSVKPRKPRGWRDAELLGQQQREADRKRKEESSQIDMSGQTCEKCKKDQYQERSQHDDMEGKVTCSCGHRVDRWKNYQAEGSLEEISQDTARSYAQKATQSKKDLINQTYRKGADTDKLNKKIQTRQQGLNRAHTDKRYYQAEQGVAEGYTVTRGIDRERYQERAGLEGPFATKIGKVVYYDPREGKYYDPDTDMYIEYDDWKAMNEASDPSGIFAAAQHNHAFIVTAEVDGKRKKFRVYHQNANLAKQKFLQHHSMATVLDVKPEATKGVTEESDDDSFNAAYVAGLRHGSAGVGNNMDRAKKEWGSSFDDYNRGFLKGRNSKAKSLKATGQGYGKKQNFRSQVDELDASTMQAYLNKRKETATPASAHQAVKQAQGVRSAKEKIADKEIEARARRTGRVSETEQVNELNYDRHADSQWNPLAANPLAAAAPFIVINKKTRLPVTKQTFPSARDAMQFIKGNPELTMVRQGSKVSENELTELSNSTLNAYIPKANRSRDQATKDMQASGKYDPKVDEKMGRRAEFTMRAKNKVNEAGGEPNTDQILEYLTSGYLMLRDNRNMFTEEGFATIERIYNGLRYDLKDGNYAGFMRSYSEYMSKYPDASVELIDAMFEAAGLESEKGTIEQFLALCSESVSSTKPVVESASAGGTGAGAIATGVAGAATGKPGTGKPKKVSNVIKRNKPAFGKGVY